MRLHEFITENIEQILSKWEDSAQTVKSPMTSIDAQKLRNQIACILATIAKDMQTANTEYVNIKKPNSRDHSSDADSPAKVHAMGRYAAGLSMDHTVLHHLILRSSVLGLWFSTVYFIDDHYIEDMIRFNEVTDQSIVESIVSYGQAAESARKNVLGVLAHDLRSPLNAVLMASDLLCKNYSLAHSEAKLAAQISASVCRANKMVGDLLDIARFNCGIGLSVNFEECNLCALCASVVEELRTGFPHTQIILNTNDTINGKYDPSRMEQVFTNLIVNAIYHGDSDQPVKVTLSQDHQYSIFTVQNSGELISPSAIPYIFTQQARYSSQAAAEKGSSAGLGLGLFIAAEIVKTHGGKIEVVSTDELGTIFTVLLPSN